MFNNILDYKLSTFYNVDVVQVTNFTEKGNYHYERTWVTTISELSVNGEGIIYHVKCS